MARTVNEIKQLLIDSIAADPILSVLYTSTSNVAIYKAMVFAFAYSAFVLEQLFDFFKADVNEIIAAKTPGTARWHVGMAKLFQYGFNLPIDSDKYNNTGVADDVIEASKIVAYAALVEEPFIRLKVAKLNGQNLAKLSDDERMAFVEYVKRFRYAGVKLKNETITSTDPDNLRLVLRIKYNPLVLNSTGGRLDGNNQEPVKEGTKKYLQSLDFNGLFSVQKLVDSLQAVDGVTDLHIDSIQTKYGNLPFTSVDIDFVPDSGYLIINDADLIISYEPQS